MTQISRELLLIASGVGNASLKGCYYFDDIMPSNEA